MGKKIVKKIIYIPIIYVMLHKSLRYPPKILTVLLLILLWENLIDLDFSQLLAMHQMFKTENPKN